MSCHRVRDIVFKSHPEDIIIITIIITIIIKFFTPPPPLHVHALVLFCPPPSLSPSPHTLRPVSRSCVELFDISPLVGFSKYGGHEELAVIRLTCCVPRHTGQTSALVLVCAAIGLCLSLHTHTYTGIHNDYLWVSTHQVLC